MPLLKYKNYFLKIHPEFSESSWQDLSNSCYFSHHLDPEKKEGWIVVEAFKRISLKCVFDFFKIHEILASSSVKFIFKHKFLFSKEDIKTLFSLILGSNLELDFLFEPPQILFEAPSENQLYLIDQVIPKFRPLVKFLFEDSITLNVRKTFVVEEVVIPEEKSDTKNYFVSPSYRSFNSKKGIFTVFYKEERVDQKKNKKFKFGIKNSKTLEFYLLSAKKTTDISVWEELQENKEYECEYELTTDPKFVNFIDGFLISAKEAENSEQSSLEDSSEKQLFPICIRTKFSAFDGLYYAKDFLCSALERGHKALGIADFSSVQAFSDLFKVSKQFGIKPLYGAEFEIINSEYPIVIGDTDLWDKQSYCVFDIETTGLNSFIDEITEISVYKYVGSEEIDRFNKFLKIKKPLKKHISELTGITNEMLEKQGQDPKKALEEFQQFIKGSLLVAHNGIVFDLPFINSKCREFGLSEINEPLLDSMRFSQAIFIQEKYKFHSLGAVCKRAGISYDETSAHRAKYDVEILVKALNNYLLPALSKKSITLQENIGQLNELLWNKQLLSHLYGQNVLVYAKDNVGIKFLYELISESHTSSYLGKPIITYEFLKKYKSNLVIVSPPLFSDFVQLILQDNWVEIAKIMEFYDYVILPPPSHFSHEICRESFSKEELENVLIKLFEFCQKFSKPCLFNRSVRYLTSEEKEKYFVLINAKGISGKRNPLYSSKFRYTEEFPDFSYKNTAEIIKEYSFLGSEEELLNIAFDNQEKFLSEISDDIEPIKTTLHPPYIEGCPEMIKRECEKAMHDFYGENIHEYILNKYKFELDCIVDNNFSVIYWVSHLLVQESLKNGYLVGSRGSVGSSFVAFLLRISEVNPLPPHYFCKDCSYFELVENWFESGFDLPNKKCSLCGNNLKKDGHNIPFETFLGFGGNKVPDIDLNFSGEYQNSAHNFLRDFFGKDKVFRAGTISSMAEKTAFGIVKTHIEETHEFEISQKKPKTKFTQGKIKWLANQIIDVKRTSGQHPGGILVVPNDYSINDFTPINHPANDVSSEWLTTHFEFEDLHDALLKFDILGHDDPTTLALLKELTGVDPSNIPYDDPKVLQVYSSCEALGIKPGSLVNDDTGAIGLPEFGTILTRNIITKCNPKSFADLIRISGFSHGTGVWKMNIDKLVEEGKKLNEVITCRDDIMIYLLSIGMDRENAFNITESIRKGKGVSQEAETILRKFKVPDWYIESAKKISYIFPKAHAAAYVLMSWKIAFYKLYYPLAFYATYFSINCGAFDWETIRTNNLEVIKNKYLDLKKQLETKKFKASVTVTNKEKSYFGIYEVVLEFLQRGFKFKEIDLNQSKCSKFIPLNEEKSLLIPLIVIDGLGEIKAKEIEDNRGSGFLNYEDFQERTSVNKTVLQTLKDKKIIPEEWLN